jgi:hypothetical protein
MLFPQAPVSRRSFLRGAGIVAALPFLESIAPQVVRAGNKSPVRPPLRLGIYTVTGGTVIESWMPKETGVLGKLPSILRSLENYKDDLLILSNLSQSGRADGQVNAHEHCAYLHLTAWTRSARSTVSRSRVFHSTSGPRN